MTGTDESSWRDATSARPELEHRRADAEAEVAVTEAALTDIRRLRADRSDDDEHDPEGTPLSAEWARLDGLRRSATQRIGELDAAIANLDAGGYGRCLRCGREIPVGRLAARPTSLRCVECASRTR